MKNLYLLPIILASILIAATIHYIEYQFAKPKPNDFCPNNIPCYNDYEKGLKAAQKLRKPIALFFTGWATGCCRTFEERTFGDEAIHSLLAEEFVLITLYVDEKTSLPLSEHFEYLNYDGKKRKVTEIGEKWSRFQINCFSRNSQPMFVVLNSYEKLLQRKPIGYTNSEEISIYLQEGLQNFQKGISKGKITCRY